MHRKDGKALTDGNGNYKTAKELYAEQMADFIDAGKKVAGAGGNSGPNGGSGLPADIKTQVQLTEHLSKLGFVANSKEFNEKFDQLKGNLPLR